MSVEYFTPREESGAVGPAPADAAAAVPGAGGAASEAGSAAPPPSGGAPSGGAPSDGAPSDGAPWGAPGGRADRPMSRAAQLRTAAIAVVATAVVVGGGFAFAQAAGGGDDSGARGGPGGQLPGGQAPGGYLPGGQAGDGARTRSGTTNALTNALHGDFVVSDGKGGYRTQRMQTGKVTQIGATSVTLASDDGYTQTYVVTASTVIDNGSDEITDVKAGHTVTIVANVSGTTATASTVTDSDLQADTQQGQPGQGNGQNRGVPGGR